MMAGIIWHPKIDTVDQHNHKPCKIRRLENLPQRTWILTVCTRYSSWTDGHNFYSTKNKKTSSQLVTAAKARLRSRKLLGDMGKYEYIYINMYMYVYIYISVNFGYAFVYRYIIV